MFKSRKQKGDFGYRNYHRNLQLAILLLLLAAIAAQLGARYLTDSKSIKNLLTVMAILTVLPMANVASPFIAALKYKSAPRAFYDACRPYEEQFPILYDLIITSKEQILPVDAAVIHPTGVYLCCTAKKFDVKKAESFVNEMLVGWKLDPNARFIGEEKTFLKRLAALKPAAEYEDDGSASYVSRLLKSISM